MNYFLSLVLAVFLFSGCVTTVVKPVIVKKNIYNRDYSHKNLNGAIVSIANQLLTSNISKTKNTSIILTSFADLNKLNQTTTFGRLVSESMFNELHVRKFKVTDFRGQDAVSVNGDGEFHITRDVDKLKDHIEATEYVVVGTYVKFEHGTILINARIIDSESGAIISTARVIYKPADCSLFDMCIQKKEDIKPPNFGIDIITDGCSSISCPTQKCKAGICINSIKP
jgi:TolB-like protein